MEPTRPQLISEGEYLYRQVEQEHIEIARKTSPPPAGRVSLGWVLKEEVCIALALYARKNGIEEGINNAD